MSKFNEEKFLSILEDKLNFGSRAMSIVRTALRKSKEEEHPFHDLRMGDVVKSSQGLRLVAHLGEDQYALIALNAFHSLNPCPQGQAVGNRIFNSHGEMIVYLVDRAYERAGHINQFVAGTEPEELELG